VLLAPFRFHKGGIARRLQQKHPRQARQNPVVRRSQHRNAFRPPVCITICVCRKRTGAFLPPDPGLQARSNWATCGSAPRQRTGWWGPSFQASLCGSSPALKPLTKLQTERTASAIHGAKPRVVAGADRSPVKQNRLRMPEGRAPSSSAWRAIGLRSRQESLQERAPGHVKQQAARPAAHCAHHRPAAIGDMTHETKAFQPRRHPQGCGRGRPPRRHDLRGDRRKPTIGQAPCLQQQKKTGESDAAHHAATVVRRFGCLE